MRMIILKYGNRLRGIRASGLRISYIWILGKIRNREDAEASSIFGTPEGTRTPDLLVRSQSLYPTELPAHTTHLSCAQV